MKRPEISDRAREVLDLIRAQRRRNGYPPTLREICAHFGWRSTNAAATHIDALKAAGYLQAERYKSRGFRLTHEGRQTASEAQCARLVDGIRRIGAALGVELTDPLPADWIRLCIEAVQARRAA